MAHLDNELLISQVKLPGSEVTYEIHDAHAIHDISELGVSGALVFKGTIEKVTDLPTANKDAQGYVYLVKDENLEYVCVDKSTNTTPNFQWEPLGNVHDAAASNHTHNVSVTVTGGNSASGVTGKVDKSVVTSVTPTTATTNISAAAPAVTPTTDNVLGADTTFTVTGGTASTTKLSATATEVAVASDGTANAITGFGAHTTDAALGTNATFKASGVAATNKMVTDVASKVSVTARSIPNVTGNSEVQASKVKNTGSTSAGVAATWTANVTNGVLSFDWKTNTPTAVTLPTFDDVTATKTTLGTAISASEVSASDVTVATGALASSGAGAAVATGISSVSVEVENADSVNAITALGTPNTAVALTGVKVTAQPTVTIKSGTAGDVTVATNVGAISVVADNNDHVASLTNVSVAAPAISGNLEVVTGVSAPSEQVGISGTAAAQTWTGSTSATCSEPV